MSQPNYLFYYHFNIIILISFFLNLLSHSPPNELHYFKIGQAVVKNSTFLYEIIDCHHRLFNNLHLRKQLCSYTLIINKSLIN